MVSMLTINDLDGKTILNINRTRSELRKTATHQLYIAVFLIYIFVYFLFYLAGDSISDNEQMILNWIMIIILALIVIFVFFNKNLKDFYFKVSKLRIVIDPNQNKISNEWNELLELDTKLKLIAYQNILILRKNEEHEIGGRIYYDQIHFLEGNNGLSLERKKYLIDEIVKYLSTKFKIPVEYIDKSVN